MFVSLARLRGEAGRSLIDGGRTHEAGGRGIRDDNPLARLALDYRRRCLKASQPQDRMERLNTAGRMSSAFCSPAPGSSAR
jgi:hypothetical protein